MKNWCFWTVVLEKTLESPLDCKEIQPVHPKGNQSWIFIGGLMLKLKLQSFGHLMQRTDSLEKTLMLGKMKAGREGDSREWNHWMASLTRWTWIWVSSRGWQWTGRPGVLQFMGSQRVRHNWAAELNWGLEWATRSPKSSWTAATLRLGTGEPNSELTAFLTWLQTPGLKWRIATLG